jgi:hypothetical protein
MSTEYTETLTDLEFEVILDRGDVTIARDPDGEVHVFLSTSVRVGGNRGYAGTEIDRDAPLYERIDQGIRSGDLEVSDDGIYVYVHGEDISTSFVSHAE